MEDLTLAYPLVSRDDEETISASSSLTSTPTVKSTSSLPSSSGPHAATQLLLSSPATRLSALRTAASQWQTIDLDGHRSVIDSDALSIVSEEERAVTARKSLADSTKGFKKLTEEDKVKQVGPIVKAYQEEINQLTRRAKSAESAYLGLYKLLIDAPDPYTLLQAGLTEVEKLQRTEESLRASQAKLLEYEAEFSGLKNQDVTVRKLESENKDLIMTMEERVAERVHEKMQEQEDMLADMKRAFAEQERSMALKVEGLTEQLHASLSQHSHLQAAVLNRDRQVSEQAELRQTSDVQMLEREMEKLMADLTAREKEMSDLRQQLRLAEEQQLDSESMELKRFEDEVNGLQTQLQIVEAQSRTYQSSYEQIQQQYNILQTQAREQEESQQQRIDSLTAEMSDLPSKAEFEEMKRQLRLLQEMEFASHDAENDVPTKADKSAKNADGTIKSPNSASTEQLFLAKCRRLESELTRHKLLTSEQDTRIASLTGDLEKTRASVEKLRNLNAKLEEDLLHANSNVVQRMVQQQSLVNPIVQASADSQLFKDDFLKDAGGAMNLLTPAGAKILSAKDKEETAANPDASSVTSEATTIQSSTPSSNAAPTAPASSSTLVTSLQQQLSQSASMLQIVLQQRDRYRTKIDLTETQCNLLTNQIEKLKLDNSVLRSDNLKLYEKMQFVKSMASNASDIEQGLREGGSGTLHRAASASSSGAASSSSSSFGSSSSDSSEQKYAALYEARLNPFAAFKKRAKTAREEGLSFGERITLQIGRAVFSKKLARNFVIFYALILHLLVMVVLWTHTVSNHCGTAGPGGKGGHAHEH